MKGKLKARRWILLAAAVLSLAGIGAGAAAVAAYEERPPQESPAAQGYILTDCGGTIGVYRGGVLILRTDVRLDGLRQADRELFEAGVEVDTYEALMRFLQDFDE